MVRRGPRDIVSRELVHHGGTEHTEKGQKAARVNILSSLCDLRASVVKSRPCVLANAIQKLANLAYRRAQRTRCHLEVRVGR